jgi:nitroreductase
MVITMTDNACSTAASTSTLATEGLRAILARRSIREYTNQPVTSAQIEQLLRAAVSAPSAGNEQPWKFIVMEDRETMNRAAGTDPGLQMLRQAAAAILVCGEPRLAKYKGFWPQDCAAATQNIVIASQMLGLGSAWMGLYPIRYRIWRIRKITRLPWRIVPFAVVSIGYAAQPKPPADRFDPRRVHLNHWSSAQDKAIRISIVAAITLFVKRHIRNLLRK